MSSTKQKPKRTAAQPRISVDFPWQVLDKILSDIDRQFSNVHFAEQLKICRAAVRNRDVKQYIAYCKSCSSLRKLHKLLQALEHSQDISGEKVLLQEIRALRLTTSFQKFDFPKSPINKLENAIKSFNKFENLCGVTNNDPIFQSYKHDEDDPKLSTYDQIVTCRVLRFAEEFILRVVGIMPDESSFNNSLRHGPGATTDKRGNSSINIIKYMPPIGCSAGAREIFFNKCTTDARWHRSNISAWLDGIRLKYDTDDERFLPFTDWLMKEVSHSAVTFVPKDAEKHRTINIEPTANLYLQLGVDGIIRKRLKSFGINLDSQEKNQVLARHASQHDDLVTMDLSGASDSVALIWLRLFPEPWARLLNALRMDRGIMNDCEVVFNKLSAMGNGFTFVVETLIFAALYYGVLRLEGETWENHVHQSSFYGDDIIIPKKFYSVYSYILHRLGFRENIEKTFSSGPIRESCGHDYYLGHRIDRPTIKSMPKQNYELVIIHNLLYDLSHRYGVCLDETLTFLVNRMSEKLFGPYDPNDMIRWIFCETSPYKPKFLRNFQAFYYKLKAYKVSHPQLYHRMFRSSTGNRSIVDYDNLHREYQIYYPLGWLATFSSRRFSMNDESPPSRTLFYLKKVLNVTVGHVLVPAERWCS